MNDITLDTLAIKVHQLVTRVAALEAGRDETLTSGERAFLKEDRDEWQAKAQTGEATIRRLASNAEIDARKIAELEATIARLTAPVTEAERIQAWRDLGHRSEAISDTNRMGDVLKAFIARRMKGEAGAVVEASVAFVCGEDRAKAAAPVGAPGGYLVFATPPSAAPPSSTGNGENAGTGTPRGQR